MVTASKGGINPRLLEILEDAAGGQLDRRQLPGLMAQFKDIGKRDYLYQLREHFTPKELDALVAVMKMNIPALNRKTYSNTHIEWMRAMAEMHGADLATTRSDGNRDLRGFYLPAGVISDRPVIWLNTDHHRVAVAATFWHELGHHLLGQLGEHSERVSILYREDYKAHMADASELFADILVVLAVYPKAVAQRLFAGFIATGRVPEASELGLCARDYLRSIAGWEFERHVPDAGNLHYLAGMIHFAKLRWALLAEYRI